MQVAAEEEPRLYPIRWGACIGFPMPRKGMFTFGPEGSCRQTAALARASPFVLDLWRRFQLNEAAVRSSNR